MKKSQKILSICLPVGFATVSLASTAAILASCSNNNVESPTPTPITPKDIYITNNDINQLSQEFNSQINAKITIDEFNNAFSGEQAKTNIPKIANALKITDANVIERVFADNGNGINKITIQVANDYKFVINDNTQTSKAITSSINENGSALIYSGIEFANGINVESVKINDLATKLDQMKSQYITKDEFNQAFSNNSTTNIPKICEVLGITNSSFVSSVTVSGSSTNATISIQAGTNCKFVLNDSNNSVKTKSNGAISNDGTTITYSNVQFYELVNITSFASNIDLPTSFVTQTSNSEINNPNSGSTTSTDVNLSYSGLNLSVISTSNSFFNVSLPNNVNGIFNDSSSINNANIEWKIKEGQTNNFDIGKTSDDKQFIYNKTGITNNDSQSFVLTASFTINNKKVANDIDVTFNFILNNYNGGNQITLNATYLKQNKAFTYRNNESIEYIETSENEITLRNNKTLKNNIIDKPSCIEDNVLFYIWIDGYVIIDAIKNVLKNHCDINQISEMRWGMPVANGSSKPISINTQDSNNLVSVQFGVTNSEPLAKFTLNWTVSIVSTDSKCPSSLTFALNFDFSYN